MLSYNVFEKIVDLDSDLLEAGFAIELVELGELEWKTLGEEVKGDIAGDLAGLNEYFFKEIRVHVVRTGNPYGFGSVIYPLCTAGEGEILNKPKMKAQVPTLQLVTPVAEKTDQKH